MKKLLENKKNLGIIAIVSAAIIIIIFMSIFIYNNSKTKSKTTVEDTLVSLGKDFYENTYYDLLEDKKLVLSAFVDSGLNINLTNLDATINFDDEVMKTFKNKNCDFEKTKVLIYPKDPFGKTDYTIKVELKCSK